MSDDIDFISNVKALATNGTLIEVLRRVEHEHTEAWKIAPTPEKREECWHVLNGIQLLANKIKSLADDEKVRQWASNRALRRA